MRRPDRVDALMTSVMLIWGMNYAIMKDAYSSFDPFAFTALRFAIAFCIVAAILKWRGVSLRVDRADIPPLLGLGLLSCTVYQIFFVIGLSTTRAGNAALLGALSPIFTFLTSIFLRHERFSKRVLGGILLSFAGVVAVVAFGSARIDFGGAIHGDAMVIISAVLWGIYPSLATRLAIKYDGMRLTFWMLLGGAASLVPLLFPFLLRQNWSSISILAWSEFGYSIFLSIVYSYLVWVYAIRHIGASGTAAYSNLTTIVALAGAWLILGEQPVLAQIVGVFLILGGVFIVRSRKAGMKSRKQEARSREAY
jgi:drug/metabolite transporter (DMT)-like permease